MAGVSTRCVNQYITRKLLQIDLPASPKYPHGQPGGKMYAGQKTHQVVCGGSGGIVRKRTRSDALALRQR
jgi:hypothetical protein